MTPINVDDPSPLPGPPENAAASAGDLAELLKRSGRGDEASFARLYDATSSRAYGLAVRVVRDPSQAEEVAQEAFLEIWRTASRYDVGKGSAVSWILTLVHRKAVAGWQPTGIGDVPVYVIPSTSGLNAHVKVADLADHLTKAAAGP